MDIEITQNFERETCIECGVCFWMPGTLRRWRLQDKKTFYCPNGHAMSYTESKSDRLERKLAERDAELARTKTDLLTYKRGCENRDLSIARLQKRIKRLKKGAVKK